MGTRNDDVIQRDPRLLPGSSAFARDRRLTASIWVWTAVLPVSIAAAGILAGLLRLPQKDVGDEVVALLGGLTIIILGGAFAIFGQSRSLTIRQRAEVAAGYTTLLKRYDQVDGIDPRTGIVVRPAVAPTQTPPAGSIGSGYELGSLDAGRGPARVVVGSPVVLAGTIAGLAALAVGATGIALDPNDFPAWSLLLIPLGILAVMLFPSLGFAYLPTRFYLSALRDEYPAATVMAGAARGGDPIGELLDDREPRLRGARDRLSGYLVLAVDRAIFYSRSGTQLVPYLELPKSRIVSASAASVATGRAISSSGTTLTVRKDDGKTVDITLGFAPERLSSPSAIGGQIDDAASAVRRWAG